MPRVRRCRYPNCHEFAYMPNHYCSKHLAHEAEYQAQKDKYCKRHSTRATTWRYNHVTRYRNPVKSQQNKFYHTQVWKSLRLRIFKRDYNLCQYCREKSGNIVDHVIPIEYDQSKMRDTNNLVTCCRECHAKKTRWEQKYYGTGIHGKITNNPPISDVRKINELMQT